MFDSRIENIEPDRVARYRISKDREPLTYSDVLNLWQSDTDFREYFTTLLRESPYSGYRWETPAITESAVDRAFEFVLINTPGFATRRTDDGTYADYFTDDDTNNGIVTFPNLRGDSTLIVPSPRTSASAYGHLAAFIREAPQSQHHSLWQTVGMQLQSQLNEKPLWLSTAGGGVAWLHVRIDSRPKYYGHTPYKTA